MIRPAAAIVCFLFCFHSFGQVVDSSRKPIRVDSSLGVYHIDSSRGFILVDSIHGKLRIDSLRGLNRLRNNNIFQFFRNAVTRGGQSDSVIKPILPRGSHTDSAALTTALNTKSESPFKPYEGKIIRKIIIKNFGFERTFTDTSKRLEHFGNKVLNDLHHKTRDWVIHNSLFVKENTPLSAFKLADNERLIRSLNFIQDVRILINYLPDTPDSVDLVVVVKDVFSIGGEIGSFGVGPTSIRGNISDANAFGSGQKILFGAFVEQNRVPNFGYQLLYSKTNIGNSFVTGTASYTQINNDLKDGTPDELAWFVKLDRPLYAPYAHLAGNITVGEFETFNRYSRPDSVFFKYHYSTHDAWIGWNLGSEKFLSNTSVRDRRFLGIRYFQNHFLQTPYQLKKDFNFRFNDRAAVLAQFTFFRQDFYKTNYVYGFGTTEDLPEGYNIALTAGWYRQLDLKRPYGGVDANNFIVTKRGGFIQYFLRAGTFLNKGKIQDGSVLVGTGYNSPLFLFDHFKIRQYVNFSYTRQFNRLAIDPLTINNVFGLRYFSGDSTFGSQRLTFHSETTFFINYRLLGFKFAPFAFADLSLLTPEKGQFSKSALYHGLGAGIRTRNENLVFQTIEMRFAYFPRKTDQNSSFKIMISTGLQFRYNNTYIKAPDIVFLNTDGVNTIY
ncbi:hypothetical protein ACX0G9_24355 [Flavitalea flava]